MLCYAVLWKNLYHRSRQKIILHQNITSYNLISKAEGEEHEVILELFFGKLAA